jgi:hypothetical protein
LHRFSTSSIRLPRYYYSTTNLFFPIYKAGTSTGNLKFKYIYTERERLREIISEMASEPSTKIPLETLSSGHNMPILALGTFDMSFDPDKPKAVIIEAIKIGYRHFDTASEYGSEGALGAAITEAVRLGLIGSRADVFITSKLRCTDNHPEHVISAIKTSLSNLKMDYLDLYLIHWPISMKPGPATYPLKREEVMPLDLKGVWKAMEECQKLGLTRSIGVKPLRICTIDLCVYKMNLLNWENRFLTIKL